ncbi:MAG: oxidoreductase, partial [Chitinophagaceae bacterium]|nr:oxidoreductase [Chitinophagaceae bacterium]
MIGNNADVHSGASPGRAVGRNIAFFGGGRWARVLIAAALQTMPESTRIVVFSPGNASGMREWVHINKAGEKITVFESTEGCLPRTFSAAIVANAVKDHRDAVQWCLENDIPVLVEKPISPDLISALQLWELSVQKRILLAPAHIFLFTEYLKNFAHKIKTTGIIDHIMIHWMDPVAEDRYGEKKSYDPSVTVFADWI